MAESSCTDGNALVMVPERTLCSCAEPADRLIGYMRGDHEGE